jgi:hypothetical protein
VGDEITQKACRCSCGAIEAWVYREFLYTGDDGVPGKTGRSWASPDGWQPIPGVGWLCPKCVGVAA